MFTKTGKIALRLLIKLDSRFKCKVICLFLFHLCEHSVDIESYVDKIFDYILDF